MPLILPDSGSLLVITPLSGSSAFLLPPYSARGCVQTLEPIDQSENLVRASDGSLMDLTREEFRKYKTSIVCKDVRAPVLNKAWQGQAVQIECACVIWMSLGDTPEREEVSGSGEVDGHFRSYRPIITARITQVRHGFAEYQADYNWMLEAEEV